MLPFLYRSFYSELRAYSQKFKTLLFIGSIVLGLTICAIFNIYWVCILSAMIHWKSLENWFSLLLIDGKLSALLLSMWFHNEKINAAMMEISKACFQDNSWKICGVWNCIIDTPCILHMSAKWKRMCTKKWYTNSTKVYFWTRSKVTAWFYVTFISLRW